MCYFITLIVPKCEATAVGAVLKKNGRNASPIDNPSVRSVLRDGEQQYLTTRGHCDCGTVLARDIEPEQTLDDRIAREVRRRRDKGWSEAKIVRAIEGMRKSGERPKDANPDTFDLWAAILQTLGQDLRLPYAGLLLRFYSGDVAMEEFRATRHEISDRTSIVEALQSLETDQVSIFPLRRRV